MLLISLDSILQEFMAFLPARLEEIFIVLCKRRGEQEPHHFPHLHLLLCLINAACACAITAATPGCQRGAKRTRREGKLSVLVFGSDQRVHELLGLWLGSWRAFELGGV